MDKPANPSNPSEPTRPERRRYRQRKIPDTSVASPCIGVCTLNEANLCDGCFRDINEIREWMIMDRAEKLAVLERVEQRQQQLFGS